MYDCFVSSGSPTKTGAVFVTRVTENLGGIPIYLRLATDEGLQAVVYQQEIPPAVFAGTGGWVKTEVKDALQPGMTYYYQFDYNGHLSPIGRCKTLPPSSATAIRVAFLTCGNQEEGFGKVYDHINNLPPEEEPDLIIWADDVFYEYTTPGGCVTGRTPIFSNPIPVGQQYYFPGCLADYRAIRVSYLSEPRLGELRRRFTFVMLPGDHDQINNCFKGVDGIIDAPGFPLRANRSTMAALGAYGLQTFKECTPTRWQNGNVWGSLPVGSVAEFLLIDSRCDRQGPPCGDEQLVYALDCPEIYAPERYMLGPSQMSWLTGRIATSPAPWLVLVSPVMFPRMMLPAPADGGPKHARLDSWQAFDAQRRQIAAHTRQRPLISLDGDMHAFASGSVLRPDGTVGVRSFMPGAATSRTFGAEVLADMGLTPEDHADAVLAVSPELQWVDCYRNGMLMVEFTTGSLTVEFWGNHAELDSPLELIRQETLSYEV